MEKSCITPLPRIRKNTSSQAELTPAEPEARAPSLAVRRTASRRDANSGRLAGLVSPSTSRPARPSRRNGKGVHAWLLDHVGVDRQIQPLKEVLDHLAGTLVLERVLGEEVDIVTPLSRPTRRPPGMTLMQCIQRTQFLLSMHLVLPLPRSAAETCSLGWNLAAGPG